MSKLINVGDTVYIDDEQDDTNFSGLGKVVAVNSQWVTVEGNWGEWDFPWRRVKLTRVVHPAAPLTLRETNPKVFIGLEEYEYEQRITNDATGGQKGRKLARFGLIPAIASRALARHYGIGAIKYDDSNWAKGYDWDLSIDAIERHLNAFRRGESVYVEKFEKDGTDYEIETHHLIAVAWQAFALYVFEKFGLGRDTRILKDS